MSSTSNFQVDLAGIISVLSEHLYSTPAVAFRELLQNAIDAIQARRRLEPGHEGCVQFELTGEPAAPTLIVEDNGIGLTAEEIHRFLSTIGGSSKRGEGREDFLGQFGIGLLSCFVLSDEVAIITRSAAGGSPVMEWRGRGDGTYTVRELAIDTEPGTRAFLKVKPSFAALCSAESLRGWLTHYGEFLPCRIRMEHGGAIHEITSPALPWRGERPLMKEDEVWEAARRFFGGDIIDIFPVRSAAAGLEGIACVAGSQRSLQVKSRHRIYVRGMLLSDQSDGPVPDWAVFLNIAANATKLRPTASRESFVEDAVLDKARAEVAADIFSWLRRLESSHPERLQRLIQVHELALKALALEEPDVLRFIAPWFTFQTSLGPMRLAEIRQQDSPEYCESIDRFRQFAPIAAANNRCLINAGYVFDADLMAAFRSEFPDLELRPLSAGDMGQQLDDLTPEQTETFDYFESVARETLRRYACTAEVRCFRPETLPVLYLENEAGHVRRAMDQSKDKADDFFASIFEDISSRIADDSRHLCCFNAANPLIRRLSAVRDRVRLAIIVEVLYVQSLLLGHCPVSPREIRLLSEGLIHLIEAGLPSGDSHPSQP